MPKCDRDEALQDDVLRFMDEQQLSASGAAALMSLERSTFWRFCRTGRARSDTRAAYRKALSQAKAKSATGVALQIPRRNAGSPPAAGADAMLPTLNELQQIKVVCEGLLSLVNFYEAQLTAPKR